MLTPAQKQTVGLIVEGVKQRRVAEAQQRASQSHQMAMSQAKGQALTAAKPKSSTSSKTPNGNKAAVASGMPQSGITPYLTGTDLLGVSDATAQAENADSSAKFGYATAAANAMQAAGDTERARVAGVSGANDDAAARGIYSSGIRAGNVGTANSAAARGQSAIQGGLAQAGVQAVAQRQAARNQLKDYLSAMTTKAAENGAALPVAPDAYNASAKPGANVKGASTTKKVRR